jgi:phosphoribosylformylglycinamidine synthase
LHGQEAGAPPPVDLAAERAAGEFVQQMAAEGALTAAHDVGDGGIAVALAEMALASGIGCTVRSPGGRDDATFFGEDQGRYLVTTLSESVEQLFAVADAAGVPAVWIGETGGDVVEIAGRSVPLDALRTAHEGWFPGYMDETGGARGIAPTPPKP